MTRIAAIADVHGDANSLNAALEEIDREGIDLIVCAGDAVDYEKPRASERVVRLLVEHGVRCIRGNHERWLLGEQRIVDPEIEHSDTVLEFLHDLPTHLQLEVDGARVVVWHGRPGSDMFGVDRDELDEDAGRGLLVEAEADVLIVGHTHSEMVYEVGGEKLIVNPGALLRSGGGPGAYVLQPGGGFERVEGSVGGTYAVIDVKARRAVIRAIAR